MFRRKSMLSIVLKIFLHGIVNFVVILGLISATKFNSHGSMQGQLLKICIIILVDGAVNYIIINKKNRLI